MKLTLDVENTTTTRNGKLHLDPFEPENSLTMVGMLADTGEQRIVTFDHQDVPATPNGKELVQEWLDNTTVLIMHNAAHDLLWLWESGFTYDGAVYDTMVFDYVWARGVKVPLSLDECCRRHQTTTKKKKGILEKYLQEGMGFDIIPHEIVEEYGIADVQSTYEVALSQSKQEGKSIEQIAAYTVPVF